MKRRNVFLGSGTPPDGFIVPPKGNDRMFAVAISDRGRVQKGTATIWRMKALMEGVAKRYPGRVIKSPFSTKRPLTLRLGRAGRVIAQIEPLEGPVVSVATKH